MGLMSHCFCELRQRLDGFEQIPSLFRKAKSVFRVQSDKPDLPEAFQAGIQDGRGKPSALFLQLSKRAPLSIPHFPQNPQHPALPEKIQQEHNGTAAARCSDAGLLFFAGHIKLCYIICSMTQENKQIITNFFEALNRKDVPAAMEYVAENIDWWVIGRAKISGHKDRRLVQLNLKMIFRSFRSFAFTIHDITAEEDRVAVTAESKGQHSGGKEYNNHYHFLFVLKNGKIEKVKEYFDTEHAMWLEAS